MTERNFDGIQFEVLRKVIDTKYNAIHDELSDCYYNKKPFRSYGILSKEQFDKLHGMIFLYRDIEFHEENFKQPLKDRIPEEKYNSILDTEGKLVMKRSDNVISRLQEFKSQGYELVI